MCFQIDDSTLERFGATRGEDGVFVRDDAYRDADAAYYHANRSARTQDEFTAAFEAKATELAEARKKKAQRDADDAYYAQLLAEAKADELARQALAAAVRSAVMREPVPA